jgi:hypothetical protein
MSPIINFFLRIFLYNGLAFGVVMLIFDLIEGTSHSPERFLYRVLFFGLFMSIVLGISQIIALKSLGVKTMTKEALSMRQSRKVLSPFSLQELKSHIQADPILKRMALTDTAEGIDLNAGMGWSSFGENITVTAKPTADQKTDYEITSTPVFKITLVDYGKNLKNVTRISNLLA